MAGEAVNCCQKWETCSRANCPRSFAVWSLQIDILIRPNRPRRRRRLSRNSSQIFSGEKNSLCYTFYCQLHIERLIFLKLYALASYTCILTAKYCNMSVNSGVMQFIQILLCKIKKQRFSADSVMQFYSYMNISN